MIAIALLLIVVQASASQNEQVISVQHDSSRSVTCWIVNNTGISCLPDSSLPQKATRESEAARASPASSLSENGPLVSTPHPQVERFQL
jgi:hypothetical protein